MFFITMNPAPPPITTKAMTAIAIISPIFPPPSSSVGSGSGDSGVGAIVTGVTVGSNGVTTGVAVGALGFAVGVTAGMAVGAGI